MKIDAPPSGRQEFIGDRDRRPRIVYIHQYYQAPEERRGSGTRSHEFAKRLGAQGFDVHIVTSERDATARKGWSSEARDGFTVHRLSVPYAHEMSYARRAWAFVQFARISGFYARRLRGDLIFATSTPLTVIVPAIIARIWRRTPQVFEVRDLWPELPIALGVLRGKLPIAAARWLEKVAYRSSQHVVALSPGMKVGIERAGVSPDRVTVIPNAADLDLFEQRRSGTNLWLETRPELSDRPLIAYCGTLNRLNGVEYLVRVAAHARKLDPEVAFVVVGSGRERSMIESLAKRLGVANSNFYLYDRVSKNDMPQVMDAASVTTSLFIPLKEMESNSANKFFDGLAAGKPVAINYGGWQKDLLESSSAGIALSPTDYEAAARDLIALARDTSRAEQLGRNARHLAQQSFSRDALANELIAVFRKLLR